MLDFIFCKNCNKPNPKYAQFCEECNSILTDEKADGLADTAADSGDTKRNYAGQSLIGICGILTIFFGGILWFVIAGIIYLPFQNRKQGWLFFVVPWVLIQIVGAIAFSR